IQGHSSELGLDQPPPLFHLCFTQKRRARCDLAPPVLVAPQRCSELPPMGTSHPKLLVGNEATRVQPYGPPEPPEPWHTTAGTARSCRSRAPRTRRCCGGGTAYS